MGWTRNKPRVTDAVDAREFLRRLSTEISLRQIARAAGVDEKTVRRWRDGTRRVSQERLQVMIDRLWPGVWSRSPRLSGDNDIGPETWTVGVGQYTRQVSAGS